MRNLLELPETKKKKPSAIKEAFSKIESQLNMLKLIGGVAITEKTKKKILLALIAVIILICTGFITVMIYLITVITQYPIPAVACIGIVLMYSAIKKIIIYLKNKKK